MRVLHGAAHSEPRCEGLTQSLIGAASDPGDVSVRPDQHSTGSGDRAKYRQLPGTCVLSIEQLDTVRPRCDVKAANLAEVEQRRLRVVQQLEGSTRTTRGRKIQVGHAASHQWVAVAQV